MKDIRFDTEGKSIKPYIFHAQAKNGGIRPKISCHNRNEKVSSRKSFAEQKWQVKYQSANLL